MRRLDSLVPEPVLVDGARLRLQRLTAAAGGLWLSAARAGQRFSAASVHEPGAAEGSQNPGPAGGGDLFPEAYGGRFPGGAAGQRLPARAPWPVTVPEGAQAAPVLPGAPGATFGPGPGGRAALLLSAGQNGGYAPGVRISDPALWTAAVIYAPGEAPARTLFAVRGEDRQKNYVFLSEEHPGLLVLRDNAESVRIELALPPGIGNWCPVLVSASDGRLTLALPGGLRAAQAGLDDLPPSAGLLLGCRAARAGMPKSLGPAVLSDLLVWPGRDLPGAGDPDGVLAAFDAFCLWEL